MKKNEDKETREALRQVIQRAADIGVDLSGQNLHTLRSAMAFFRSLDHILAEAARLETERAKYAITPTNICAVGLLSRSTITENPHIKALLNASREIAEADTKTVKVSRERLRQLTEENATYKDWHDRNLDMELKLNEIMEENRILLAENLKLRAIVERRNEVLAEKVPVKSGP